jgi:hypothetical protein
MALEFKQDESPYYAEEAATIERRPSHVGSALLSIDEEGQQLLEAIRELERRLGDVLRSDVDSPDKVGGEPRATLVALAERLTSHSGTVRMARQYVVSILERLEL